MPLAPFSVSVTAKVAITSAQSPLVMKVLPPLRMYSSPSRRAVADMATALEPAPLSVRAKPMMPPFKKMSATHRFCHSLPAIFTGAKPKPNTREAKPASPLASSSRIMAVVRLSRPRPPYSSGRDTRLSPMPMACSTRSWGTMASRSATRQVGLTAFWANSRTISRRSSWSWVSRKS